jgi:two-component system, NarL family, sensor histidine kinase UhpB
MRLEALYKAILDHIPDQAWLKDRDSRYVHVNEAFCKACELPLDKIIGRFPQDVWPADWARRYVQTDSAVVQSNRRSCYEEWRYVRDGLRWFETIKTPLTDEHGAVVGTVGISRDITERKRAGEALHESRAQLRELSGYLQTVREAERTRISRELHDELGQSLSALHLGLGLLEAQHTAADTARGASPNETPEFREPRETLNDLRALREIASTTLAAVQRIAADLRPPMLDELGLAAAIEWQLETFSERSGITSTLKLPEEPINPSHETGTALFRTLQEALTNTRRHSGAREISVTLEARPDMLVLTICDDGCGIRPSGSARRHLGLLGMRERAEMMGGSFSITSEPRHGTTIEVCVPLVAQTRRIERSAA